MYVCVKAALIAADNWALFAGVGRGNPCRKTLF
jgi:hypothetical protein